MRERGTAKGEKEGQQKERKREREREGGGGRGGGEREKCQNRMWKHTPAQILQNILLLSFGAPKVSGPSSGICKVKRVLMWSCISLPCVVVCGRTHTRTYQFNF